MSNVRSEVNFKPLTKFFFEYRRVLAVITRTTGSPGSATSAPAARSSAQRRPWRLASRIVFGGSVTSSRWSRRAKPRPSRHAALTKSQPLKFQTDPLPQGLVSPHFPRWRDGSEGRTVIECNEVHRFSAFILRSAHLLEPSASVGPKAVNIRFKGVFGRGAAFRRR